MLEALKAYLDDQRINKTAFADRVGISKQHLHGILRGKPCSKAVEEKITQCIEVPHLLSVVESLQNQVWNLQSSLENLRWAVLKDLASVTNLVRDPYASYETFFNCQSEVRKHIESSR